MSGLKKQFAGDLAGALRDFELAVSLRPQSANYVNARNAARAALGPAGLSRPGDQSLPANASGQSFFERATARYNRGDYPGALADFQEAARREPTALDPHMWQARTQESSGKLAEAIAEYTLVVQMNPDFAPAHAQRGRLHALRGEWLRARRDAEVVVQLQPGNENAYLFRGEVRAAQGDLAGAEADFSEALRLNPKFYPAQLQRADVRQLRDNCPEALTDLNLVLALQPGLTDALQLRAVVESKMSEPDAALADINRVVEVKPDFGPAYGIRASIQTSRGALDEALADATKFFSLQKETAQMHRLRGGIMEMKGETAAAIEDYDAVIRLEDPGQPQARYAHLFRHLLRRIDDREEARGELGKVVAGWPEDWAKAIGRFLSGSLPQADFLAKADEGDPKTVAEHRCEAFYYAGRAAELEGHPDTAAEFYRQCRATKVARFTEYRLAGHYLAKLEARQP